MQADLRGDRRGAADLPLRLFAGVIASAALMAVAAGGAEMARSRGEAEWASATLDDLAGLVHQVGGRPGSEARFLFDPPPSVRPLGLRLFHAQAVGAPLVGEVEHQGHAIASRLICGGCTVEWVSPLAGSFERTGRFTLELTSPGPGTVRIAAVPA